MSSVKWGLAEKVARRFAGRYPLADTYHTAILRRDAPSIVAEAAALVAEETRLTAPGSPEVLVVDRGDWVRANLSVFSQLLAPVEQRLAERKSGIGSRLAERIMAAEVGAVLGLMARRVLGQYEMVLPTADGSAGDQVMFVGANVLEMERRHEFRPAEFRFWVALHECTHRLQFTGVPWLRDHFLALVGELVELSVPGPGRMARVREEIRRSAEAGEPLIGEAGLMGLLATDEQKHLIDKIQALMSLLEGHGHVVMDRIGAVRLLGQRRMSRILKTRRQGRAGTLFRLMGIEMKLRQYELGERFVLTVEREAGFGALSFAWVGPDRLPTLAEIHEPVRWLERVA